MSPYNSFLHWWLIAVLSQTFIISTQQQLSWMVWLWVLHKVCHQAEGLTWAKTLASKLTFVVVESSLLNDGWRPQFLITRSPCVVWVSSWHSSWRWPKRGRASDGSSNLVEPNLRRNTISSVPSCGSHKSVLGQCGRRGLEVTQGCVYQEVKIPGGSLGSCLPPLPFHTALSAQNALYPSCLPASVLLILKDWFKFDFFL